VLDFFSSIFSKFTSLVASVIIAVGLVSAPALPPEASQPVEAVVEVTEEAKEEPKDEQDSAKLEENNIVTLPPPVASVVSPAPEPVVVSEPEVTPQPAVAPAPQPTPEPLIQQPQEPENLTTIITLPSGEVVEIDENGNIIRIIQEAPTTPTQDILEQILQSVQQIQENTTLPPPPPPAPTPASTLAPEPTPAPETPSLAHIGLNTVANDGIHKSWADHPEVGEELLFMIWIRNEDNKVVYTPGEMLMIEVTDSEQNTILESHENMPTMWQGYEDENTEHYTYKAPYYEFIYKLTSAGQHTITARANGLIKSLTFEVFDILPPPPPQTEIIQTNLVETVAIYTFYNRTNKYIGYPSAIVKVWQSKIVNPHENVSIKVYDVNMVSKAGFTVPASSITGTSEESATIVTIPLPNELSQYCNYCGHMVIPTPRANYPEDVASYIRFEINASDTGNSNDRYFIKLVSFEGETFGTNETQTVLGTVYTF